MNHPNIDQLIEQCKTLVEKLTNTGSAGYFARTLVEKIIGDAAGNVTGAQLRQDCPSATRERLSMAHEIAASNEKETRAKMESLSGLIDNAKKAGTDTSAYEAEFKKHKTQRDINIKNMQRLESIESDYAVKFKPGDNKYDQRGHAMFLEKSRERLEARKKEAESSSMPDLDRIAALERRIGRVDTAQKESKTWLETNDKNWVAMKDRAVAAKEAENAPKGRGGKKTTPPQTSGTGGTTPPKGTPVPTTATPPAPTTTSTGTAEPAKDDGLTPQQRGIQRKKDAEAAAKPGSIWKTPNGFGAKNADGKIDYFSSASHNNPEEQAKVYSKKTGTPATRRDGSVTTSRRRGVDRKTAVKKPPTKPKAMPKTAKKTKRRVAVEGFAADLVGKKLQSLNETYAKQSVKEETKWTVADFRQGIKDLLALIEKHQKLAHAAKKAGDTAEYNKQRGIISEFSHDIKTTQEMIKRAERAAQMSEAVHGIVSNRLRGMAK